MTQPSTNLNPILRSEQILHAFSTVLRARLPLNLQQTHITPDAVYHVLCYASMHQASIEASCQELAGAPSGNRLCEVLRAALPAAASKHGPDRARPAGPVPLSLWAAAARA